MKRRGKDEKVMKCNGFLIESCPDVGIERINERTGVSEICKGYYCQVFAEEDDMCEQELDSFCLAVGYEIHDLSEEALEAGIRNYLQ